MQLEDSIGYWLSYAQRCFASVFSEVLRTHCVQRGKPYIISHAQWGILVLLSQHERLTIGALAQQLGVDGPAVTNIVKRLEHSGVVERLRDHKDERIVYVSLTAEGKDIFGSLHPLVAQLQEKVFLIDQRQAFIEHLQQFIAQVSRVGPVGDRFNFIRDLSQQEGYEQRDSFLKEDA